LHIAIITLVTILATPFNAITMKIRHAILALPSAIASDTYCRLALPLCHIFIADIIGIELLYYYFSHIISHGCRYFH
jgi:hypothetical protein